MNEKFADIHYSLDRCEKCGKCISQCPVLKIPEGKAKEFMEQLSQGIWVAEVLERCTGCMSCDAICPNDAGPYGLLLRHYEERYRKSGIPQVFLNATPVRNGPNIWRTTRRFFSEDEKRNVVAWSKIPVNDEVLFLGCNQRLDPFIADSPIFDGIEIFTDPRECCGEPYMRLGLLDEARKRARSLSLRFKQAGIKKVITFCPACQNMMQNLSPEILGVSYDVEVTGAVDWLSSRIENQEMGNSLRGKTVTIQDPCHATGLGEETVIKVREILKKAGLNIIEMETHGTRAECCGLSAAVSRYRLSDVIGTGLKRAKQAELTGADLTCAWCNGCYITLNMFRLAYPFTPPIFHLVEILELAGGMTSKRRMPARAAQLLAAASGSLFLDGFRFRKVHLE
ncbi:MAG: (Fe-S)-binding protein [Actinomycetota bacterium]|nr:(Fe-S)-binding protein [Actinomycetota bacterium]